MTTANLSNWKEEAWKNQGSNGTRTRDPRASLSSVAAVQNELFHIFHIIIIIWRPWAGFCLSF